MNCVIAGAGGFIGRHLGRHLLASGRDVLGLDVSPAIRADLGFPLERCDVLADDVPVLDGVDVIYYLSQSPFYRSFPDGAGHVFGVNVAGALRVAEAGLRHGVRAFVYASTGTVYAPSFAPMRETDEVRRDQPYALSKRSAEEALALLAAAGAGGMRVTCVRLFGVFGPEQAAGLVPGVVARVREGRPVVLERNPRDAADRDGLRMSLTYVADLAACLAALGEAMRDGRDVPALLNVAGTEAVSIRRLAERAGAAIGAVPRFEEVDRDRESDYVADVTRLQHLLRPRFTPLDAALAGTVA